MEKPITERRQEERENEWEGKIKAPKESFIPCLLCLFLPCLYFPLFSGLGFGQFYSFWVFHYFFLTEISFLIVDTELMFFVSFFAAPLTDKPPKILFPAENKMSIMEIQLGKQPGISSSTLLTPDWESWPFSCLSKSVPCLYLMCHVYDGHS